MNKKHLTQITAYALLFLTALLPLQTIEANTYDPLEVTCTPSENPAEVGELVTWEADVDGGTGNYTYIWSNGGSTGSTMTRSYITPGQQTDAVVVSDGRTTTTGVCSITVVRDDTNTTTNTNSTGGNTDDDDDLSVRCNVSDTTVREGDVVDFTAEVDGGSGQYDYDWDWDIDGDDEVMRIRFNNEGSYEARLTVRDSEGNMDVDVCPVIEVDNDNSSNNNNDGDLDLRCRVSDTRVREGDVVAYEVEIDGGDSPYDIEWLGDIDGNDDTERVRYDREGRYEVDVEVEDDDGERERVSCPDVIVDEYNYSNTGSNSSRTIYTNNSYHGSNNTGYNTSSGTIFSLFGGTNANQIQTYNGGNGNNIIANANYGQNAGVNSVLLSQVPYTGPADVLKVLGILILTLAVSFAGALQLKKRRGVQVVTNKIASFKEMNKSASKIYYILH